MNNIEPNFSYPQMQVQATDLGTPQLSSQLVNVNIFVRRNNFAPVFELNRYSTTIQESTQIGQTVINPRAYDNDTIVSSVDTQIMKTPIIASQVIFNISYCSTRND